MELIEWQESLMALRTLKKGTPKDFVESIHREILSGRLSVEGNVVSIVWFLNILKTMGTIFSDSRIFVMI